MVVAKPILRVYKNEFYSKIVIDANRTTHYWDLNGSYGGWDRENSTIKAQIVCDFFFTYIPN